LDPAATMFVGAIRRGIDFWWKIVRDEENLHESIGGLIARRRHTSRDLLVRDVVGEKRSYIAH
jgi:hypothetical protein